MQILHIVKHQIRRWEITHLQTGTRYNVCKNKQTSVKKIMN